MSNEAISLSRQPSGADEPPVAAASDADKMRRALERMKAAVRVKPGAVARLRGELEDMLELVGGVRAALLADADPGALLDELEHRAARMIVALDPAAAGNVAEAEAPEFEHPARGAGTPLATLAGAAIEEAARPPDEQAFLDAMGDGETPHEHAAEPPQQHAARVPTVSGVISQLGIAGDTGDEARGESVAPAGETTTVAMLELMVQELTASMPAELRSGNAEAVVPEAAEPEARTPEEIAPEQHVSAVPAPSFDAVSQEAPVTAEIEAAAELETPDAIAAAPSPVEPEASLPEASVPLETLAAAQIAEPEAAQVEPVETEVFALGAIEVTAQDWADALAEDALAQDAFPEDAFAEEPLAEAPLAEELIAQPALASPEPPVASATDSPIADASEPASEPASGPIAGTAIEYLLARIERSLATPPEQATLAEPEPAAGVVEPLVEEPVVAAAEPAGEFAAPQSDALSIDANPLTEDTAAADATSEPPVARAAIPETELLSNFALMKTMPFLPPEIGQAVIFERSHADAEPEPQPEPVASDDAAPEPQARPEAALAMPSIDLIEPAPAEPPALAAMPDAPPPEETDAAPHRALAEAQAPDELEPDIDLDALLFGTPAGDDPAAPMPSPVSAGTSPPPAAPARPAADPLAPLRAMSDEEKIAIFE